MSIDGVKAALGESRWLQFGAGGLIVTLIGLFGPWASVSLGPLSVSVSGFKSGDGKLVLIAAIVAVIGLYLKNRWLALVPSVIAGLIVLYDIVDIGRVSSGVDVGTGWGIWINLIGAAVLVYASVMMLREQSQS